MSFCRWPALLIFAGFLTACGSDGESSTMSILKHLSFSTIVAMSLFPSVAFSGPFGFDINDKKPPDNRYEYCRKSYHYENTYNCSTSPNPYPRTKRGYIVGYLNDIGYTYIGAIIDERQPWESTRGSNQGHQEAIQGNQPGAATRGSNQGRHPGKPTRGGIQGNQPGEATRGTIHDPLQEALQAYMEILQREVQARQANQESIVIPIRANLGLIDALNNIYGKYDLFDKDQPEYNEAYFWSVGYNDIDNIQYTVTDTEERLSYFTIHYKKETGSNNIWLPPLSRDPVCLPI